MSTTELKDKAMQQFIHHSCHSTAGSRPMTKNIYNEKIKNTQNC